jgi:2'-5' RNA ligase
VRPAPLAEGELCIGVSIAVPAPYGAQLADARARFRDPAASLIPPHVTLLGPTTVRRDDLTAVDAYLTAVAARHRSFDLRLAGAATFRPISPVTFVQVVEGGPACAALADEVRTGPLAQDLRFEYHPHVTVAQGVDDDLLDAAQAGMADYVAEFSVTGFSRYEHGADGLWRPARTFGLAAGLAARPV